MREIKFRAWDKVNELMSKVTSLTYNNMNQQLIILNKKKIILVVYFVM